MATRIVCVFPGQGSQVVGMGKDLWEADDAVKALYQGALQDLGDPATLFKNANTTADYDALSAPFA